MLATVHIRPRIFLGRELHTKRRRTEVSDLITGSLMPSVGAESFSNRRWSSSQNGASTGSTTCARLRTGAAARSVS